MPNSARLSMKAQTWAWVKRGWKITPNSEQDPVKSRRNSACWG